MGVVDQNKYCEIKKKNLKKIKSKVKPFLIGVFKKKNIDFIKNKKNE